MSEPHQKRSKVAYGWKNHGKSNRFSLQTGMRGFMCTCNFSEKSCLKEAYNILNLYADQLYSKADVSSGSRSTEDVVDVSDELDREIANLKAESTESRWRFQAIDSGFKNCLFIKTSLPDPVELATTIAKDILSSKKQQTRHLLRLVPIEIVCKATPASITENIQELLDKYFKTDTKSFGVVFNRRNNNSVNKDEIIAKIAAMVVERNSEHKVALKNPDLSILVEVVRAWCLISILPDYNKFKKYNLIELSGKPVEENLEDKKLNENSS